MQDAPLWSLRISLCALLVAGLSLGWNIVRDTRDRRERLRVRLGWGVARPDDRYVVWHLSFEITNSSPTRELVVSPDIVVSSSKLTPRQQRWFAKVAGREQRLSLLRLPNAIRLRPYETQTFELKVPLKTITEMRAIWLFDSIGRLHPVPRRIIASVRERALQAAPQE